MPAPLRPRSHAIPREGGRRGPASTRRCAGRRPARHRRARVGAVLVLRGSVGASGADRLASLLDQLIRRQGGRTLTVDLRGVSTMAEACVLVLGQAAARAAASGGGIRIGAPPPAIAEAFAVAGLAHLVGPGSEEPPQDRRLRAVNHSRQREGW